MSDDGIPINFTFCPRCGEQMNPKHDASSLAAPNCYAKWFVVWRNGEPIAAFPTRQIADGWIAEAPHRRFDRVFQFGKAPSPQKIRRADFASLRDYNRAYQRERRLHNND